MEVTRSALFYNNDKCLKEGIYKQYFFAKDKVITFGSSLPIWVWLAIGGVVVLVIAIVLYCKCKGDKDETDDEMLAKVKSQY